MKNNYTMHILYLAKIKTTLTIKRRCCPPNTHFFSATYSNYPILRTPCIQL